jgi:hypothetical protein
MAKKIEIIAEINFIGRVNEFKDCLMSQDETGVRPDSYWFNIDVPHGHEFQQGDRVRVTVEKVDFSKDR